MGILTKLIVTSLLFLLAFLSNAQELQENTITALKNNDIESVKKEIESGTLPINACYALNDKTYSLLSLAVKLKSETLLDALLAMKPNLDLICEDKSVLMYAAKYGELQMMKKIIEAGATISLKNNEGKTAMDYAVKYDQKTIVEFLNTQKK